MNIRQVRKRVDFWVDILGLKEWTIKTRWGTKAEMADKVTGGNAGLNDISVEYAFSEIILDKGQSDEECEHTVVHELLHLVYDGHKPQNGRYDPMHERAVNRTADALMTLHQMNAERSNTE